MFCQIIWIFQKTHSDHSSLPDYVWCLQPRDYCPKHVLSIKVTAKSDSRPALVFLAHACFLVEFPLHKDQMEHLILEN